MNRTDWSDLATIAAIANAGSLAGAATELRVSASAVSHQLRGIEDRLGVRLFNRTTRSLAPTEAGDQLLSALRPAFGVVTDVLESLAAARAVPAGRLRISSHRIAAVHFLLPHLPRFARDYPQVDLELIIEDGLTDIVADRFDAGVRHEQMLDLDMTSVRISPAFPIVIAASLGYLGAAGIPLVPQDILTHRCLNYQHTTSRLTEPWRFERSGQRITLNAPAGFLSNDADLLMQAAIAGAGLVYLLEPQAKPHLASGALVQVLAEWSYLVPPNHLYYSNRRQMTAALRAFIDTIKSTDQ